MGFSQTFARTIAYRFSNKSDLFKQNIDQELHKYNSISATYKSMTWVYSRLAIFAFFILMTVGSLSVAVPISASTEPGHAWLAWFVLVLGICFFVYGNSYGAFIIGANRIDLLKKGEIVVGFGSIISQFIALLYGNSLFLLVVVWQFVQVVVNAVLVKKVKEDHLIKSDEQSP